MRLAAATLALVVIAGCGDDDGASEIAESSTAVASIQPSAPGTGDDATGPSPQTVLTPTETPTTSTPTPTAVVVDVTIAGGQVTTPKERVPVSAGETVRITVTTDAADELHVHGVEQTLQLQAGAANVLEFQVPADLAPGLYEVETHDSGLLLLELELS